MTDSRNTDASKKPGDDEMILVKVPRKDLKISDEELDKVSGGRASVGGYGTLDYETMTCHGGD